MASSTIAQKATALNQEARRVERDLDLIEFWSAAVDGAIRKIPEYSRLHGVERDVKAA